MILLIVKINFLIFRSMNIASDIYGYIMSRLGDLAWLTNIRDPYMRTVDVYHRSCTSEDQVRVTEEFTKEDSVIRCVIATIAFGMGVQVPDVRYVFHWGCSASPLSYWQEIGRCSRDGKSGTCYLYLYPGALDKRRVDEKMISICKNTQCLRIQLLEHLTVTGMNLCRIQELKEREICTKNCDGCKCKYCICCSRCIESCLCNKK